MGGTSSLDPDNCPPQPVENVARSRGINITYRVQVLEGALRSTSPAQMHLAIVRALPQLVGLWYAEPVRENTKRKPRLRRTAAKNRKV
ncbi:hypothetical protein HJFPF1_07888 [Paramyrothecium foliicola]|nr:hypothetical protein HJFPF1_07888 [Paramyrothecium foliicola]